MNCASCCSDCVPISEIDKWTSGISNLLMSGPGRSRFKQFLHSRSLDDAAQVLAFWENLDNLQHRIEWEIETDSGFPRNKRLRELEDLYKYADENINFDFRQLEALSRFRTETDPKKICEILKQAKQSSMELLRDEHQIFSQYILRSTLKCAPCT